MPSVEMFAALEKVTVPRRVKLPAAPTTEILPVPAFKVMLPGPSRVLFRVIGFAVVLREALPATVMAEAKLIELEPLMALLKVEAPDPFWVKAPLLVQVAAKVKRPELETVTGPLAVVFTAALNVKLLPTRETPLNVFVLTAPERVVVPVPPSCTNAPALIAPSVALAVCEMVKDVRRVRAPMAEEVVILPVPALKVRV